MPTIAIVGAGPDLGFSVAQVFGGHDFSIALVARDLALVEGVAARLHELDIDAAAFPGDLMDRSSIVQAFKSINQRYGPVDVLEFSPADHDASEPGLVMAGSLDVSVANVQPQIDLYVHGAITAVGQVLPDMIEQGSGTLLFTTAASSVDPNAMVGNVGIAGAALRNWVLGLHQALTDTGVYAVHVPVGLTSAMDAGPQADPDPIAELHWDLHTRREEPEHLYLPR